MDQQPIPTATSHLCSLPAPEFRGRLAQIHALLEAAAPLALRDGVEFRFAPSAETAHALADFILFERVCCSTVTYQLRSEPDHSYLLLRLTAPPADVPALHVLYLNRPEAASRS